MKEGTDKTGAMEDIIDRLAEKKINVRTTCAICAGDHRQGARLWVAPARRPCGARALGAQGADHHHV